MVNFVDPAHPAFTEYAGHFVKIKQDIADLPRCRHGGFRVTERGVFVNGTPLPVRMNGLYEGPKESLYPFTVVAANAFVRTAAGVSKAWDGSVSFTGNRVKLDNSGATDWAAGDVLFCLASG